VNVPLLSRLQRPNRACGRGAILELHKLIEELLNIPETDDDVTQTIIEKEVLEVIVG
jgi:hypothetical protein